MRYLGENVRIASARDLAWLCASFGRFLAIAHAACLCEAEEVDFSFYPTLFPENERVRYYANVIATQDYQNHTATLSVWRAVLKGFNTGAGKRASIRIFPIWQPACSKKPLTQYMGKRTSCLCSRYCGPGLEFSRCVCVGACPRC